MEVLIVHGPNLDLLGRREPEVYGSTTLDDLDSLIQGWGESMGVAVETEQTNHEGAIVDLIHETTADGVVINPGALTHTSRSIADAIRGIAIPVVEVHISNIWEREPWRAESLLSGACVRTIYGRGVVGYREAIRHLANRAAMTFETTRYGPHPDQVGDLRRGDDDLVVVVHGGVWRHEYERDTTESLAVDLSQRGCHTWNIEYRRIGRGGGWPASAHDVLMALDFIPQLPVPARRVIVVGHSAGSHLLMWAVERTATPVDLHVALAPLTDLEGSVSRGDACAPQSRWMMAQGAPPRMRPGAVETVIVHGTGDQIVAVGGSDRLGMEGIEMHRTEIDHFSLLDPGRSEWQWVIGRLGIH